MRLGKINDHSGNQAYYYINSKEILCTLRIWMLVSLNRSCLATIRSPPQWPCFYATEKRNFSCLIGACIYQDLWECVILMRVNLVQKDTEIVPRYNLPKNTDIIKYFCRHQQNYKKNMAVKCVLLSYSLLLTTLFIITFSFSFVWFLSELHKPLTSKDSPSWGFILLKILCHKLLAASLSLSC